MYLPTFWKLTSEAYGYRVRHVGGWILPLSLFVMWIGKDSLYNMYFSVISKPPRGVAKKER